MSTPFLLIASGPFRGSYANVPYGLGVLAAVLENNGFPVHVRDYVAQHYDHDDLVSLIRHQGIKIVAVSMMTPQAEWAYVMVNRLKKEIPHLFFLCGGAHPTFVRGEPLEYGFDIAFRREAEESLVALLPMLVEGDLNPSALKEIDGLAYLVDGELVTTRLPKRIKDLDNVPFPARHLFPFPHSYPPQISLNSGYCAHFFTSRGCPERCGFCAQPYRNGVFYRSPENVVDEIEYVKRRFNISHFYVNDDNFCHNNQRAIEICELMIRRGINLPWVASFARIEPVCEEMFRAMKRSGCQAVTFGVESGDPDVRRAIHKRGTNEDTLKAVRYAQAAGLMAGATFMFGHPTETRDHAERTIKFARKLRADYSSFAINCPYPGSADYRYFKKRNLIFADSWSDYWIQDRPIIATEHLSTKELVALKRKAFIRCYSNPWWWIRQAGNLLRTRDVRLGIRVATNIIKEMYSYGFSPKDKVASRRKIPVSS